MQVHPFGSAGGAVVVEGGEAFLILPVSGRYVGRRIWPADIMYSELER